MSTKRMLIRMGVAVACVLLVAGCELLGFYGESNASDPVKAELDVAFELELGQTAEIDEVDLALQFTKLEEDSRCPTGAVCIWEGRVVAALLISRDRQRAALTVDGWVDGAPGETAPSVEALGFRVELLALRPYPAVDRPAGSPRVTAVLRVVRP